MSVLVENMLQKPFVVANWKMNHGVKHSVEAAADIVVGLKQLAFNGTVVVCPIGPALMAVHKVIEDSSIKLGAQDVSWEDKGSFTGEIAPWMLREVGVEYVIIGHSERRKYLGETDEMVNKKTKNALEEGMVPIVCVGETFEQRQEGEQEHVVMRQVQKTLDGIDIGAVHSLMFAYEPIWAIGTGQAIDADEADHMHSVIHQILIDHYPEQVVNKNTTILYGGSADEKNTPGFLEKRHINGFLVGTASIKSEQFVEVVKSVHNAT